MNRCNDHAGIVGNYKTVGIGGIDPDVVRVAAPADFLKVLARIQRLMEGAVSYIDFVVAPCRHRNPDVVARTANQGALVIDDLPMLSSIIRSPDRALVLGLYQRKDAIRVCWSNG